MQLSIVATLYNSAPCLVEFHRRAGQAARRLAGGDYEIVLVNDGSPDNSLDLALGLAAVDPQLVVVDLSRNFGHHKAMMTGLAQAAGDRVFLIDSDLEEEPEWLDGFAARLAAEKCDVVYGVQQRRRGRRFERWAGRGFYRLFRALSGLDLPQDLVTARLMTRRYVDALLRHEEREIMIAGLWLLTGFDQRAQPVTKRRSRRSSYTLGRKLALLANALTSFSSAPLLMIFQAGLMICALSGAVALYLAGRWLVAPQPVSGWTVMILSLWLLGGLIITALGIIGVYVAKIFSEVKRRPYTIIRQVYRQDEGDPGDPRRRPPLPPGR